MGGGEIIAYCAIEMVEFPYEFSFPISNAFGLVFGIRDRSRSNVHLYHLPEESLIRQEPVIFACLCEGMWILSIYWESFKRVLLNFQKPGPLGLLFGKVSEMKIALSSGAIAGKISDFFIYTVRSLAIRKKSILDFTRKDFDSYVNFRSFGWRTLWMSIKSNNSIVVEIKLL